VAPAAVSSPRSRSPAAQAAAADAEAVDPAAAQAADAAAADAATQPAAQAATPAAQEEVSPPVTKVASPAAQAADLIPLEQVRMLVRKPIAPAELASAAIAPASLPANGLSGTSRVTPSQRGAPWPIPVTPVASALPSSTQSLSGQPAAAAKVTSHNALGFPFLRKRHRPFRPTATAHRPCFFAEWAFRCRRPRFYGCVEVLSSPPRLWRSCPQWKAPVRSPPRPPRWVVVSGPRDPVPSLDCSSPS